ncbi:DUF3310 domain-containing protein [Staphylococcus xylosus]|uniref:DUF3310 domain-containing protein n=1 Tax=Staphylococcus xylosus TaxID=1288 RepID=UPI003F57E75F
MKKQIDDLKVGNFVVLTLRNGQEVTGRITYIDYNLKMADLKAFEGTTYIIDNADTFDLWSNYIESKTESVSEKGIIVDKKHYDNIDEEHFYHKARVEAMHNAIENTRGYVNEYLSNDVQQRKRNDTVNHPSHYMLGNLEVKDIVALVADKYHKGSVAHNIASAIEYEMRAPEKNGLEDIKKARKCLDFAIENWEVK